MGCNVGKDVKVDEKRNNGASDRCKESVSMSEEQAAEKIQASFRGYKTRKILKDNGMTVTTTTRSGTSTGDDDATTTEKPGSALSTDPQEVVDIDLNDAELERAAFKIQASYRNFTAKKKELQESNQEEVKQIEECLEDIDLEDPDVEKAALKIQSTFRGYKVRKEVEAK